MALPSWHEQVEYDRALHVLANNNNIIRQGFRSYEIMIELIGNIPAKGGLKISSGIDYEIYGKKAVTDEDLKKINHIRDE